LILVEVYLMGFYSGCALICAYILDRKPGGIKGIMLSAPYISSPAWHNDQHPNISLMPAEIGTVIEACEETGKYDEEYQEAMMDYYGKHECLLSLWPGNP
jgi:hypothetical protein